MANHPSAEKRNRQRVKRTTANRATKSAVRTDLKKARALVASKSADAKAAVVDAESVLARAASKGAISKKSAARKTSRLAKALHKAVAAAKLALMRDRVEEPGRPALRVLWAGRRRGRAH